MVSASGAITEESDDSSDDSGDSVDDLKSTTIRKKDKSRKYSVTAEPYGKNPPKMEPKVYPKSQEEKVRIKERLSTAFMFNALDGKDRDVVIDAMKKVEVT